MGDPFRSNAKQQLIREARIGLSVVAILLSLFVYVAFYKITGRGRSSVDTLRPRPASTESSQSFAPIKHVSKLAEQTNTQSTPQQSLEENPRDRSVTKHSRITTNEFNSSQSKNFAQSDDESSADFKKKAAPVLSPEKIEHQATRTQPDGESRVPKQLGNSINSFLKNLGSRKRADTKRVRQQPNAGNDFQPLNNSEKTKGTAPQLIPSEVLVSKPDPTTGRPATSRNKSLLGANRRRPDLTASTENNSFSPIQDQANPKQTSGHAANTSPEQPTEPDSSTQLASHETLDRHNSAPVQHDIAHSFAPVEPNGPPLDASSAHTNESNRTTPVHSPSYVVREGEGYWSISTDIYKDGRYFRALYEHNKSVIPLFELNPGAQISTPDKSDLRRLWPDLCPTDDLASEESSADDNVKQTIPQSTKRVYVTRQGDTLFAIAGQKLDQASRFMDIYRINQVRLESLVDPYKELPVGVRLVLPAR